MKNKIFALLLMATATLVMLTGCVIGGAGGLNTVRGRGELVSHEIAASGFTGINIGGAYELTFRQSPEFSVTLDIQENLFEYIETSVRNNVFHITGRSGIGINTGSNTPRLIVYAPDLQYLNIRGAVSADINVETEDLEINVSGAGSLNFSGNVDSLHINSSGVASISAFDLVAANANIRLSGVGSIEVYATDTLDVTLSGVGSVTYDGNPLVTSNRTGLGSISSR